VTWVRGVNVLEVLVVDGGIGLHGYDCRDVLAVEELPPTREGAAHEAFVVRLGRLGTPREIRCREVLGFFKLTPRDVRPLPAIVSERIAGEAPWAVGIIDRGLCLLY
jgi:hypothetical protein